MRKDIVRKEFNTPFSFPTIVDSFFNDSDRFFNFNLAPATRVWSPTTDVYETETDYHIDMELPGLAKEDIGIEVKNGVLTIHGERKYENEEKDQDFHRCERYYGTFQRSWTLPKSANPEKISAEYTDGVLKVQLAKRPEEQPRKIDIKVQ